MKRAAKWIVIIAGGLIVLIVAALLIIPMFVDVQKYKPEIEEQVAKATGRPFGIGGDLKLSLFPWARFAFSDLHLGNPPGFQEKDFVSVKSFDVQVKLLPLLFRDVQVKRFVLEGPRVVLEKAKDGRGNWEGIAKPSPDVSTKTPEEKPRPAEKEEGGRLPLKALAVGEFAVTGGSALWLDHATGERREITDMTLQLQDVSLDRPIAVVLKAQLDGKPLSLEGRVGPLGDDPGEGAVPLDFTVKAFNEVNVTLKGRVVDPAESPRFELALQVSPFSPRRLMAALEKPFPVVTTDPEALTRLALKGNLSGGPERVSISDGGLDLDQSKLTFSLKAKEFSKPDVEFKMTLDEIDLDRYLPPTAEKEGDGGEKKAPAAEKKKTDYSPLRKPVLNATVVIGKLKVKGAKLQDIRMRLHGKGGVYTVDPFSFKAYEGDMMSKATLDVTRDSPKTSLSLEGNGFLVRPLLQDVLAKDFLEGTTFAKLNLRLEGDDAAGIKQTLNGDGDLRFTDGAVVGIDLPGMFRNVKAAFGVGEKTTERPKTDFSELLVLFTAKDGVVHTSQTSMKSPLLRVLATGQTDLVKETLDFRVEPKVVGTLKGQEDAKERSGLTVPVIVGGTFTSPTFKPDLKGVLEKTLKEGIPSPSKLKEMLKGGTGQQTKQKPPEETVKGLLKSLPFGQ